MGHVKTRITLKNIGDTFKAKAGLIVEDIPEILLGVLPLEGMGLMVDTVNQRLLGAHGDRPMYLVMSIYKK